MYHISNDKRAQNSLNKICNATLSLLKIKDFLDITISDIQKTASVGRSTFYRLFDNTADILAFLCDNIFLEASQEFEKINPTPEETTKLFIEKCMKQKELLTTIVQANRLDFLQNAHTKFFKEQYNKFFPNLEKNDLNYMLTTLTSCVSAFVISWVQNGGKETPEELHQKLKLCFNLLGKIFN